MNFCFLIPWNNSADAARVKSFDWNTERIGRLAGCAAPLLVGGQTEEGWSRGRAINALAAASTSDILVILDSDTAFNMGTLVDGLEAVLAGASWVIPYSTYYRVSSASSTAILDLDPTEELQSSLYEYDIVMHAPSTGGYDDPQSGLLIVRREDFLRVGGFCPAFEGWGYEDRAFVHVMDSLVGRHERLDGEVFHLWHDEPGETTWEQPNLAHNRDLFNRMLGMSGEQLLATNRGEG